MIGTESDFENTALKDFPSYTFTRARISNTTDSFGNITDSSESTEDFKVVFASITHKDRQILERGIAEIGDLRIWFKWSDDIQTGDVLRGEREWKVREITSEYPNVYKEAVLNSLDA